MTETTTDGADTDTEEQPAPEWVDKLIEQQSEQLALIEEVAERLDVELPEGDR